MRIDVVYALSLKQEQVMLDLAQGSTVQDAIQASGFLRSLPDIDVSCAGVWGRPVGMETGLRDGDRVEIYRPLVADPKEIRRVRAAKSRN
ncbi:MAG: RnfH family protein [Betaproteobacteria bacterium]|nr:MAG: RnfH family protein [Betaproteobacteria bacterium]